MIDYFALLHEPRRPWLEAELLRAKFLQLSAEAHPDHFHNAEDSQKQQANDRAAELNAAYQCLREPKTRLLHLFELETGARPREIQQIPSGTMELFMEVGQLCRAVDAFLAQNANVTSPLLKVEIFERAQEWTGQLQTLQRKINASRKELLAALNQMNPAWESAPAAGASRLASLPLSALEQAGRDFSYLTRWSAQIQERIVRLSF